MNEQTDSIWDVKSYQLGFCSPHPFSPFNHVAAIFLSNGFSIDAAPQAFLYFRTSTGGETPNLDQKKKILYLHYHISSFELISDLLRTNRKIQVYWNKTGKWQRAGIVVDNVSIDPPNEKVAPADRDTTNDDPDHPPRQVSRFEVHYDSGASAPRITLSGPNSDGGMIRFTDRANNNDLEKHTPFEMRMHYSLFPAISRTLELWKECETPVWLAEKFVRLQEKPSIDMHWTAITMNGVIKRSP